MSHNFCLLLVICGLFCSTYAQSTKDESSTQIIAPNNNIPTSRGFRSIPKFVVQMMTRSMRNIFQNLMNLLRRFEKYAITMLGDTLSFLAGSDSTALVRRRRSPRLENSQQDAEQNGGGVVSIFSNLFMMPFKLAFGAVKWVPEAIFKSSVDIGVAVADDVLKSPIFQSLAEMGVVRADKIANETWNFATVNVFPRLDKWVTKVRKAHVLPDNVITFLTEIQTAYHIYRLLGLA